VKSARRADGASQSPVHDRVVVVGVSGGIAAYKSCELVRWLVTRGAHVVVVMTPAACEFVTPLTFQTLSGNPVITNLWGDQAPPLAVGKAGAKVKGRVAHVDVAESADLIVLAPATADLMARMAHGESPDALTTVLLASRAPLVVCPAMDLEMWRKKSTQESVATLRSRGATIVGPERGSLASGLAGPGRMSEPETIGAAIEVVLAHRGTMTGMRVLVSAGRTEEPIDPVRVLTNRSSGRMGVALAEAARDRGAEVVMVAGPMDVEPSGGIRVIPVSTAAEMARALEAEARDADTILMAAAVADFRPARVAAEKIRRAGASRTLALEPNADILERLGRARRPGQVIVGFALETSGGVARAREKLRAKGADLIVLNAPQDSLGRETNRATLVEARAARRLPEMRKRELADRILERAIEMRGGRAVRRPRSRKRGQG
jgi:phosphopantothenoylcysteine decarboxylase / phosphopantothenate---cysteine ligase